MYTREEYLKTKQIRWSVTHQDWELHVTLDNELIVIKDNEPREYTIKPTINIQDEGEYVYLDIDERTYYQFKFEVDSAFVGDIFDNDGNWIDSVAYHVFGEKTEI